VFPATPPGASAEGAGHGCRIFMIVDKAEKKIFAQLNLFIF
jgi:hypothetical protein